MNRRDLIRVSLTAVSGVGAFFASIPFIRSLMPSAKARAQGDPIEVDLSGIEAGAVAAHLYRGETMLILHRTPEMLAAVAAAEPFVLHDITNPDYADPRYVDPQHRAIDPEFLVLRGVCTHLGCVPQRKGVEGKQVVGEWWPGGFICPCHSSGFDYAGRVIRGPAPRNLPIPPHRYSGRTRLVIGEEPIAT